MILTFFQWTYTLNQNGISSAFFNFGTYIFWYPSRRAEYNYFLFHRSQKNCRQVYFSRSTMTLLPHLNAFPMHPKMCPSSKIFKFRRLLIFKFLKKKNWFSRQSRSEHLPWLHEEFRHNRSILRELRGDSILNLLRRLRILVLPHFYWLFKGGHDKTNFQIEILDATGLELIGLGLVTRIGLMFS